MAVTTIANQGLRDLLRYFPKGMSYAFAYGSGVFTQKDQQPGKMTDLVFVVDDPMTWHTKNLEMNWHHYSFLHFLGPTVITFIQERMACGVYYNPYCELDGMLVKYGVISTKALEEDLRTWKHLYIAGRLHKPVLDLVAPTTEKLSESLTHNRFTALRAALLLRGRTIAKFDLYHDIAELSYMGDTRMKLAENPQKTRNIVEPLMPEFEKIYMPLFLAMPGSSTTSEDTVVQDIAASTRYGHLISLPIPIQVNIAKAFMRDPKIIDIEEVLADISHIPVPGVFVRAAITEIVSEASIKQTAQGILTAGLRRSFSYVFEKFKKRYQGIKDPSDDELDETSASKKVTIVEETLTRKPPR